MLEYRRAHDAAYDGVEPRAVAAPGEYRDAFDLVRAGRRRAPSRRSGFLCVVIEMILSRSCSIRHDRRSIIFAIGSGGGKQSSAPADRSTVLRRRPRRRVATVFLTVPGNLLFFAFQKGGRSSTLHGNQETHAASAYRRKEVHITMRTIIVLCLALLIALSFGCSKKKEEAPKTGSDAAPAASSGAGRQDRARPSIW